MIFHVGGLGVRTILLVMLSVWSWFEMLAQFMKSTCIYAAGSRSEIGSQAHEMHYAALVIYLHFHLGMLTKTIKQSSIPCPFLPIPPGLSTKSSKIRMLNSLKFLFFSLIILQILLNTDAKFSFLKCHFHQVAFLLKIVSPPLPTIEVLPLLARSQSFP